MYDKTNVKPAYDLVCIITKVIKIKTGKNPNYI